MVGQSIRKEQVVVDVPSNCLCLVLQRLVCRWDSTYPVPNIENCRSDLPCEFFCRESVLFCRCLRIGRALLVEGATLARRSTRCTPGGDWQTRAEKFQKAAGRNIS
jgi:hypothetical protein